MAVTITIKGQPIKGQPSKGNIRSGAAADKKKSLKVSVPRGAPAGAGSGLGRLQQHNIAAKIPTKTEL
jgi:hypothetical protein